MWDALEKVGMKDRVMAVPEGLDVPLAATGQAGPANSLSLSAGEEQLLCAARLLVPFFRARLPNASAPPPRIVLCDEPTSALDAASDECVHKALVGLNATVIVVCHRLAHLELFDAVAVMAGGAHY